MTTVFAFTPRKGAERLLGPVRAVSVHDAAMEDRFGAWVECVPLKVRAERYQRDGTLCERDHFDRSGRFRDRAVFAYDGDGRLGERTHYDHAGQATARFYYSYDSSGRLVEMAGYDPTGGHLSRLRRDYDADGALRAMIEVEGDRWTRWSFRMDPSGAIIAADGTIAVADQPAGRLAIRYDRHGAMRDGARYDAGGIPQARWRYRYDGARERGNWTRRITEYQVDKFGRDTFEPTLVTYRRFAFFGAGQDHQSETV
ncbi:MAG: hypothetical protein QF926_16655 [Alphaproteobacteria bacterium]|jgi:hypothetical protein|nr:hypothetical protein [Alphaproteobacteria bacterium]MDP6518236.1 hypothetical protein [Alphaproteobacteria bacterium]